MKWFPGSNEDEMSQDAVEHFNKCDQLTKREKCEGLVRSRINLARSASGPDIALRILRALFLQFPKECGESGPDDPLFAMKLECIELLLTISLEACVRSPEIAIDGTADGENDEKLHLTTKDSIFLYRHYELILEKSRSIRNTLPKEIICRLAKMCYTFGYGDLMLRLFNSNLIPAEHRLYTYLLEYTLAYFVHATKSDVCLDRTNHFLAISNRPSKLINAYNRALNPAIDDESAMTIFRTHSNAVGNRLRVRECSCKEMLYTWNSDENDCEQIGKRLLEFVRRARSQAKCPLVSTWIHIFRQKGSSDRSEQLHRLRKRKASKFEEAPLRRSGRGTNSVSTDSWIQGLADSLEKQVNSLKLKRENCQNELFFQSENYFDLTSSVDQSDLVSEFFDSFPKPAKLSLVDLIIIYVETLSINCLPTKVGWSKELWHSFRDLSNILFETKINSLSVRVYTNYIRLAYIHDWAQMRKSRFLLYAVANLHGRPDLDDDSLIMLAYYVMSLGLRDWIPMVCDILAGVQNSKVVLSYQPTISFNHIAQKVTKAICSEQLLTDPCELSIETYLDEANLDIPDKIVDSVFESKNPNLICRMYQCIRVLTPQFLNNTDTVGDCHQFCVLKRLMSALTTGNWVESDEYWIAFLKTFERVCMLRKPDKLETRLCNICDLIHGNLGRNASCTLKSNGKFLRYLTNRLFFYYKHSNTENETAPVLQNLQQCLACLWGAFPLSRKDKNKYVEEHVCVKRSLTSENCSVVYWAYAPDVLPIPSEYKCSVFSDIESDNIVYKLITDALGIRIGHADLFIDKLLEDDKIAAPGGWQQTIIDRIIKNQRNQKELCSKIPDFPYVLYLTADCYLKSARYREAFDNYTADLMINPTHQLSWAGLLFCYLQDIMQVIDNHEYGDHEYVLGVNSCICYNLIDKLKPAIMKFSRSFQMARFLGDLNEQILKTYAVTTYTIASVISKHLKRLKDESYGKANFSLSESSQLHEMRSRLIAEAKAIFEYLIKAANCDSSIERSELLIWTAKIAFKENRVMDALNQLQLSMILAHHENPTIFRVAKPPSSTLTRILEIFYLTGSVGIRILNDWKTDLIHHELVNVLCSISTVFPMPDRTKDNCSKIASELTLVCMQRVALAIRKRTANSNAVNYLETMLPVITRTSLTLLVLVTYHQTYNYKAKFKIGQFLEFGEQTPQSLQTLQTFLCDGITWETNKRKRKIEGIFGHYSPLEPFAMFKRHTEGGNCLRELRPTFSSFIRKSTLLLIKSFSTEQEKLCELTQYLIKRIVGQSKFLNELDRYSLCRIAYEKACAAFVHHWPAINALSPNERRSKCITRRQMLARMYRHYMIGPNALGIQDNELAVIMRGIYTMITKKQSDNIGEVLRFCQAGLLNIQVNDRIDD